MTFPLSSNPAGFANFSWSTRNGTYYHGETVAATLSQSGATFWEVRDYDGNSVATGSVSGTALNLGSSWNYGWYRVYLTVLGNPDPTYGLSRGVSNFVVVPASANFVTRPAKPPTQPGNGAPGKHGGPPDIPSRAMLGLGPWRMILPDAANPTTTANDSLTVGVADQALVNTWQLQSATYDTVRAMKQWCAFTGDTSPTVDNITFSNYVFAFVKDLTVNGGTTYVATGTGTSANTDKITVYSPDSSTVVETFDNLANSAAAETAINGVSNYIHVCRAASSGVQRAPTQAATLIGRTRRDGTATSVSTLYPLGVTHFEGPRNEPDFSAAYLGTAWAQHMKLFAAAVHEGNAAAKAIGPCTVSIDAGQTLGWDAFIAAGGLDSCDEISFHDYNAVANGDLNLGRNVIEAFIAKITAAGYGSKKLWQTEANNTRHQIAGNLSTTVGVYHPRRTRETMLKTLLWEQYGLPRERNPLWYDYSIGFWAYPSWLWSGDSSPQPTVAAIYTLARETYGYTHQHRVDFGSVSANRIFLGSVYGNAGGSVAALMCAAQIPSASVTLTVTGTTGTLTSVDTWGNESTLTQSSGRVTVNVGDMPTYVRLPTNVSVAVYSVNDWGTSPSPAVGSFALTKTLGGSPSSTIADNSYMTRYTGGVSSPGYASSTASLPDDAVLKWDQDVSVERVLVWCGPAWQSMPILVDYDIDTWDGAAWTTRKTVTNTAPSSFVHGSDSTNSGSKYDTYWTEQWIFDTKLTSPVTCSGVRLHVRALSYGGEPDAQAATSAGQGIATPTLGFTEMSVLSPTTISLGSGYTTEVLADSPNGYWRLGEPSGTTAVSQVNAANVNGTYQNSPTLGVAGTINDGDTAVLFSTGGSVQQVSVASHALLRFGDTMTLECWFKPTTLNTNQTMIGKAGSYGVQLRSDNAFALAVPGVAVLAETTSTLVAGTWYHLVATKAGSAVHLYVNGADVTGTVTNQTLVDNANAFTIGANNLATATIGALDEVAAYPTALSAARVTAHYKAGIAPSVPTNTAAPTLEGVYRVNAQASAVAGTWSQSPASYTYQWQQSDNGSTGWSNIASATATTYVIPSTKAGKYLRCQVTATNAAGDSTAASSAASTQIPSGTTTQRVGGVFI